MKWPLLGGGEDLRLPCKTKQVRLKMKALVMTGDW